MHYIENSYDEVIEKRSKVKNIFLNSTGLNDDLINFSDHHIKDLIDLYDNIFFDDFFFSKNVNWFTYLSRQLRSSAGSIQRKRMKRIFKIKLSIPVLLENDYNYEKQVNGIIIDSCLEAVMITLEHELIHAYQYCIYNTSNHRNTFKIESYAIFGHTRTTHSLHSKKTLIVI
jgi:hypothetical protein